MLNEQLEKPPNALTGIKDLLQDKKVDLVSDMIEECIRENIKKVKETKIVIVIVIALKKFSYLTSLMT